MPVGTFTSWPGLIVIVSTAAAYKSSPAEPSVPLDGIIALSLVFVINIQHGFQPNSKYNRNFISKSAKSLNFSVYLVFHPLLRFLAQS